MVSELVERLRDPHHLSDVDHAQSRDSVIDAVKTMRAERAEAANRIESLSRQLEEAREARLLTIKELLDAYDVETATVPLGAESRSRGASVYNWRRAVVEELRDLAAVRAKETVSNA